MKSMEALVDKKSDYYVNSPTTIIRESFLYPTHLGHFYYLPGYRQHRIRFDSFLLMYVLEGSLTLEYESQKIQAHKDNFILIDCYQEHCYYSDTGWEATWIHFDGFSARNMYNMIIHNLGNLFSLEDPLPILNRMAKIYQPFSGKELIREVLISKYLNDLLTELIIYTPLQIRNVQRASTIENVKAYITEHIQENLSVEDLARKALLSTYYFIRIFKRETGMSPHEYIINHRIQIAKVLLTETRMTVNDICFEAGFSSSSIFCAAFKKNVGVSPTAYRKERAHS